MEFTYYGDLLGMLECYKLNPDTAKNKLDNFYTITFECLSGYCRSHSTNIKCWMFSDSLFMYGDDARSAIEELCKVYVMLLRNGIFLRGGMVKGKLGFERKYGLENFEKSLPENDILARAVGLEKAKKGARLLLERELAVELLVNHREWLTLDGYVRDLHAHGEQMLNEHLLRRISPTPEQDYYECLYFMGCPQNEYVEIIKDLEAIRPMLANEHAEHYKETIALLKRCQKRQSLTPMQSSSHE
jgi:hypothetical protein